MPATSLPRISYEGTAVHLVVGGSPFLLLGIQWDCDSCANLEEMIPLFAFATDLHANTAALPLYWREVEPEPGRYEFQLLDERLRQARKHNLRLVLLWFGTWKNACSFYCPTYIKRDTSTYPRARSADGREAPSLCPLGEATFTRDRAALVATLQHLRAADDEATVILFQIENEPGLITTPRCYCDRCSQQYVNGQWQRDWGQDADEAFTVSCIASYIERLTQAAKLAYNIPYYVNVAIPSAGGSRPGDYFSGGAVPWMLELFRNRAPSLAFIAPDIYTSGYRDFQRLSAHYRQLSGPLYVAEHSSGPQGRAERNVFYAIGDHAAIGFDPWAIDAAFPDIDEGESFVDVATNTVRAHGKRLGESYRAISLAMSAICAAQGTARLFTFVQEDGEQESEFCAEKCDVILKYHEPSHMARGFVIQEAQDIFLLVGLGFSAFFREPRPSGRPRPILRAEWGRYEGDRWILLHPIRREHPELAGRPIRVPKPGVARIVLEPVQHAV